MSVPVQYKDKLVSWEAGGALTQYAACVSNADGTCVVGAGSNDTGFVGVSIEAVDSGYAAALAGVGAIVPVQVGVTGITQGCELIIHDASGRVGPVGTASGTAYNVIGTAREDGDTVGDTISMTVTPYIKRAQA